MSTAAVAPQTLPTALNRDTTVGAWLFTTDHRRLARLYLIAVTSFAVIGALAMGLTRLELLTPTADVMSPFVFGRLSSLHGTLMLFFFLLPAIPMVFGTGLLPGMVGARSPAFPRLALAAWYLFVAGGLLVLGAALFGGVDTGWAYAVTTPGAVGYASAAGIAGTFLACCSFLLYGINVLATVHAMRAPGLRNRDLPLFVWALYASVLILMVAVPVLGMALLLGGVEIVFQTGLFDPAQGGDPMILPQLAGFFSAPAAFLILLPGMGVVCDILASASRRALPDRRVVAVSFFALAGLSLLSFRHQVPTGETLSPLAISLSLAGPLAIVPFLLIVAQWTRSLRQGAVHINAALLYALGFILMTTIGMFLGLFLSPLGPYAYLRNTTFDVAQFHYLVMGGGLLALLAALHHWWKDLTGRFLPETFSRATAIVVFFGLQLCFLPLFALGQLGAPAGHATYPPEFQPFEILAVAGASVFGLGLLLSLAGLLWSLTRPRTTTESPPAAA